MTLPGFNGSRVRARPAHVVDVPQRRRPRVGWQRGTTVYLLLLSQLLCTLHFSLVRHGFCFAHGEAIDQHGDASPAPSHERGTASRDELSLSGRGEPSAELRHPHEHCLSQAHRRDGTLEARLLSSVDCWTAPAAFCECTTLWRTDRTALLRVAPKQSPPA